VSGRVVNEQIVSSGESKRRRTRFNKARIEEIGSGLDQKGIGVSPFDTIFRNSNTDTVSGSAGIAPEKIMIRKVVLLVGEEDSTALGPVLFRENESMSSPFSGICGVFGGSKGEHGSFAVVGSVEEIVKTISESNTRVFSTAGFGDIVEG